MSHHPFEPEQEMLLPASLRDWLPKGHLAYFIGDTVDALDLKAFAPATPQVARATSRSSPR